MPRLWTETIDGHRRAVRDATLDAAAELVAAHGLASVTMSGIAERAGIGRATLYKYFPDVDAVVTAWHQRQISTHLEQLEGIAAREGSARTRLDAVLAHYARLQQSSAPHRGSELGAALHRETHVVHARGRLHTFVHDLLVDATRAGDVRADIPSDELASYCIHALDAAGALPTAAALDRLVALTLSALHPPTVDRS